MTIEEIRDIPIAVFLARMGYEPARRRGDEYWYLAPYREERTASFQLNVRKDIWHDFGTGQGGDIFTLAGEFIGKVEYVTSLSGAEVMPDFLSYIHLERGGAFLPIRGQIPVFVTPSSCRFISHPCQKSGDRDSFYLFYSHRWYSFNG